MAIGTPVSLGSTTNSGSTSIARSTSGAAPSSSKLFAAVGWFSSPSALTASVAGGSLTWTQDAAFPQTNGTARYGLSMFSAEAPSGLAASTSITATFSGTTGPAFIMAAYATGLASASFVDSTPASTFRTTPTATWTTPSLTTTNADDLLWALALADDSGTGRSSTAGGSFTELFDVENSSAMLMTVTYRIVAATGSYAGSGTWSLAPEFADVAGIVAYKSAGGGGGGTVVKQLAALGVG